MAYLRWVDSHLPELSDWRRILWHYAEPAFREYKSSAWSVACLRRAGFTVEAGSGGMPTAFVVILHERSRADPGRLCGNMMRYRATARPPQPRGDHNRTVKVSAGHTDPHFGPRYKCPRRALAVKAMMEQHRIGGTLKLFGEPAEKLRPPDRSSGEGVYDGSMLRELSSPLLVACAIYRRLGHSLRCRLQLYLYLTCDEPENWIAADRVNPIPQNHLSARVTRSERWRWCCSTT